MMLHGPTRSLLLILDRAQGPEAIALQGDTNERKRTSDLSVSDLHHERVDKLERNVAVVCQDALPVSRGR